MCTNQEQSNGNRFVRHEGDQIIGKSILFLTQKQVHRNQARCFQKASQTGKTTDANCRSILRSFTRQTNRRITLEHKTSKQIKDDAWRYLLDVGHFTRAHTIKAGKILSFHAKAVACVKKGKIGEDFEFG